jgi:hypothetical protein
MGDKQNQNKGGDKAMRHGEYQGAGSQDKGQGQYQGKGLNKDEPTYGQTPDQGQGTWKDDQTTPPGGWNDRAQRDMQQGDMTKPAYPSGTDPLDKDEHPVNKTRPVQQNR